MDHLHRSLAPVSDAAWHEIDEEASRTLQQFLAARAIIDVSGPKGWTHAAEPLGRIDPVEFGSVAGVDAALRRVQPLVELRARFEVDRAEIDAIDRGAPAPELAPVTNAAKQAGLAEDAAIFHGSEAAGVIGIIGASPHDAVQIGESYSDYPSKVAKAVAELKTSGVGGPYAIALGPRCYQGVVETTEHGGYPVFEHLRNILGGQIVWAPGVDGAVVISARGGDYVIQSGQDFSVGYLDHATDTVRLYIEESLTLTINDESAAVAMVHTS